MNRKWRTNYASFDTVAPYHTFRAVIPPGDPLPPGEPPLASPTDLYAVYTVLHIENKPSKLLWSPQGRFHYFVAVQQLAAKGSAPLQAAAAEGDEDPPEVVPEGEGDAAAAVGDEDEQGGGAAKRPRGPLPTAAEAGEAARAQEGLAGGGPPAQQQQQQASGATGAEQQQQQQQEAPGATGAEQQQQEAPEGAAEQQQGQPSVSDGDGAAPPPATRTQILVPVSSGHTGLTPELLHRLFSIRGVQAQQLLLALVDGNGVVTRCCMYNYVQAPLEGPGTATLELLDD